MDSQYRGLTRARDQFATSLSRAARLADVAVSVMAVYLSVWFYEIANWVAFAAAGANVTFSWAGFLPSGVASVTTVGSGFLYAKLAQVGLCLSLSVAAFLSLRGRGLPLTKVTLAGLMGIYAASVYWEMLSLASFMPFAVHEVAYIGLSAATAIGFMRILDRPFANGGRGRHFAVHNSLSSRLRSWSQAPQSGLSLLQAAQRAATSRQETAHHRAQIAYEPS